MKLLTLTDKNLEQEHICCAIADKKTAPGVELKKEWLKNRFRDGLVFRKADIRLFFSTTQYKTTDGDFGMNTDDCLSFC